MSKYEFVPGETREFLGTTLRRIRARSNFGAVSAGDVGGWIESEGNLAQTGDAWVYGAARVCGAAHLLCIGPIGSRCATLTVTRDSKMGLRYTTGCFSGPRADFVSAVDTKHPNGVYRVEYGAALKMIDAWAQAHGHLPKIRAEAAA